MAGGEGGEEIIHHLPRRLLPHALRPPLHHLVQIRFRVRIYCHVTARVLPHERHGEDLRHNNIVTHARTSLTHTAVTLTYHTDTHADRRTDRRYASRRTRNRRGGSHIFVLGDGGLREGEGHIGRRARAWPQFDSHRHWERAPGIEALHHLAEAGIQAQDGPWRCAEGDLVLCVRAHVVRVIAPPRRYDRLLVWLGFGHAREGEGTVCK